MPPKRKRSDDENRRDSSNPNSKRFAYLKPRVRQVPERTIKAKWTTLPEAAQGKIRDIFRVVERPVIVRQNNERKRIEAQSAVQTFEKKYVHAMVPGLHPAISAIGQPAIPVANFCSWICSLGKRLPRMVFPPATKESSFEFEAGLDEHVCGDA